MGERADGTWAAKQVGVSAPRQNGKSQLIVARALTGALLFGERKIIISAHAQDTARETFHKLVEQIDASPALAERIAHRGVMNAINREKISFKNGAVIQFKARTVSGSRGFSSDCLLLDEAQILGMPAWVSINSTMSARPNPQIWLLGTPPTPEDNPEVFASIRASALAGASTALAWLEWAADPTDDPALETTRAKANPAWYTRINHEVVQGEFETYPAERFALDRLGIWSDDQVQRVIPANVWSDLVADRPAAAPTGLAVDMSHDRLVAVAGCVALDEGAAYVELLAVDYQRDTLAAVEWLAEKAGRRIPVFIDGASPAASMVPALKERKVRVTVTTASDMGKACGMFYDDVMAGRLAHAGQAQLDQALAGARKRNIRDAGAWGWDRKDESTNIAPLVAATLARLAAATKQARTGRAVFA